MAWTTIKGTEDNIDEQMQAFEDDAGTTSIDSYSLASHGHGQVVALVNYTAA